MKVQFNFDKKHFYILLVIFAVFGGIIYVRGLSSSSPPTPWHPLQEVSTSSSGATSVDVDSNGVVDDSDRLNNRAGSYYEQLNQNSNALSINGQTVYWSGSSLCYDQSASCAGLPSSTACSASNVDITANLGDPTCVNTECDSACEARVACNGDISSVCIGANAGTTSNYQNGVCKNGQGSACSGGKCQCTCSSPQPTYLRENPVAPTTKCATFV